MLTAHIPLPNCTAEALWLETTSLGWYRIVTNDHRGRANWVFECTKDKEHARRMLSELQQRITVAKALES